MYSVKSQEDYNALEWDDKLYYGAQNPGNPYSKNEMKRTESVLDSAPTDAAKNWWAQQNYINRGGDVQKAISGDFDKNQYGWGVGTQVRPAMNAYAISDDRIGYRDGKVTLDGKDFLTPDSVANGRSYVANEKSLQDAFSAYNQANEVMPARSYIENQHLGIEVGWDAATGEVLVGSTRLKPDYISPDGRAQVSKSRLDAALAQEKANTGLYTNRDILQGVQDKYGSRIDALYDKLEDRGTFTYDLHNDPIYKAFEEQWMKQTNSAYDDTIAKLNTQSGGAPSLGAMAAAWNLKNQLQDQLAGYQNQFREQAYQKWMDDYSRDLAALETLTALRKDEFDRAYGVNRDTYNDMWTDKAWVQELIRAGIENAMNQQAIDQSKELFPWTLKTAEQQYKTTEQAYKNEQQQYNQSAALFPYELEEAEYNKLMNELALSQAYGNFSGRSGGGGNPGGSYSSDWEDDYVVPGGTGGVIVVPETKETAINPVTGFWLNNQEKQVPMELSALIAQRLANGAPLTLNPKAESITVNDILQFVNN